jgi:hypothetical protein
MLNEEQQAELLERFLVSREGDEWQGFVEATKKTLADAPEAETVLVPAAFLREAIVDIATNPLMFLHMKEAWNREAAALNLTEEGK